MLRTMKLLKSPFHEVIVADLPEYQFGENKFYELDVASFQKLAKKKPIVFLFGRFFRDYTNFEKYKHIIRGYFAPISTVQSCVDKMMAAARKNSDIVVGVHIRRGDYAEFMNGKYFYSPEQYAEKLTILKSSLMDKRVTFIICSNEKIDPSVFGNMNFIMGAGRPVEDMYLLAECDFIMGPPSTFSSWASFYGNKRLYQIKDINQPISFESFVYLSPTILYNF